MTTTPTPPAADLPNPDHPAHRVTFRDSDHSYRIRNACDACSETGRVAGKREGTTKKCPSCKGEGARFERVPAVSTILAELNKPALVPWAARMAAEAVKQRVLTEAAAGTPATPAELELLATELYVIADGAHRDLKDEAAATGTTVHDWITTLGNDILTAELPGDPEIRPACEAFVAWFRTSGYTIDTAEKIVVEEHSRYAGRFDLLLRDSRDRPWILDIKTSNSVYMEHVLQCSAYATALRQELRESIAGTIVAWAHREGRPIRTVIRTPREYRADYRVFSALLGIYEHRKSLGGELRALARASDAAAEAARDAVEFPFMATA